MKRSTRPNSSAPWRGAVNDIVAKRQVATGIDIVSDGETSKIGYATYIQRAANGFGPGQVERPVEARIPTVASFPNSMRRLGAT